MKRSVRTSRCATTRLTSVIRIVAIAEETRLIAVRGLPIGIESLFSITGGRRVVILVQIQIFHEHRRSLVRFAQRIGSGCQLGDFRSETLRHRGRGAAVLILIGRRCDRNDSGRRVGEAWSRNGFPLPFALVDVQTLKIIFRLFRWNRNRFLHVDLRRRKVTRRTFVFLDGLAFLLFVTREVETAQRFVVVQQKFARRGEICSEWNVFFDVIGVQPLVDRRHQPMDGRRRRGRSKGFLRLVFDVGMSFEMRRGHRTMPMSNADVSNSRGVLKRVQRALRTVVGRRNVRHQTRSAFRSDERISEDVR